MQTSTATECNSVVIVHEELFVSHSIESLLVQNGFTVVKNVEWISDLDDDDAREAPDLAIVGYFEPMDRFLNVCTSLREKYPNCRLMLIDAGFSREAMQAARIQGMFAYFSFRLTPEMILNGIRLVQAGNECFPTEPKKSLCNAARSNGSQNTAHDISFTPREHEVLNLIAAGLSNKVIARELCISESTVKGYANALLRKTETSNRTQAACWAIKHGYG